MFGYDGCGPAYRYSAENQSYRLIWFSCRDPKLPFRNAPYGAIRRYLNQSELVSVRLGHG